jgi:hypothetical protein
MNAEEENSGQPHETEQSSRTEESVIHAVARAAGSAVGGITSAVAHVAPSSNATERQAGEGKSNRRGSSGNSERSRDKYSEARMASKKRKKAAHRRVLRRSHANG